MNLSKQAGLSAAQNVAAQFNSGHLYLYNGPMPANPETALSGTTLLATFTFAATAFPTFLFDTNGYQKANAAFAANPVTPVASNTVFFARAQTSGGTTIADFTMGQGWTTSLVVQQSQYIMANGNLYICVKAGTTASSGPGPNTTAAYISDGTAAWMYLQPGSPDILLTSAALSTGTPLNLPYLWLAMPCL